MAKNRYEGELGIVPLKFDRESLSFAAKPKKEKETDQKEEETSLACRIAEKKKMITVL